MSNSFDLEDAPVAPAAAPPYLETLNDAQRAAVEATEGPVLVLAGAGTGKTRVLTTRLAHILRQGKARSWEVMAVTFTNKAAREMRERVAAILGMPIEGWWVGTFHATGARMLRSHAEVVGLKPNFTILDDDDQIRLLKQIAAPHHFDERRWPTRVLMGQIQRWKDRGLSPAKVSGAEGAEIADGGLLALYHEYQERLKSLNAVDFGDLLLHCLTVFQERPDILAQYHEKFRYLLVDEYQDSNVAQYLWLRLLAQQRRNICCVGDDDQSIYSWRGAEVGNILRFEQDFPGARIIRLERNYRSTPHILAAASRLIAHNAGRLGKTLWTDVGEGEKLRVSGLWDGEDEARMVADEIESLHGRRKPLNEMAVLVRAGFQTREFEERLMRRAIPYRVIGGPRFYERQEVRDAVAYVRVVAQPDDDLAFERIVNVPKRGLGPATLQTLHKLARAEGIPLTQSTQRLVETDELKPQARSVLQKLMADFDRWRGLVGQLHHPDLAAQILEESGYTAMWKSLTRADKSLEAAGRLDNLKELIAAMEDFETLEAFLEHVSLVMENEQSNAGDKVTLMTLHGAKGLEFDTVFLPGWEEELFPHRRALDEGGASALEEERRLAYVGLTRARERVHISFVANRRIYNQWQSAIPSRFIDELPPENVDVVSRPGLYGSGAGRPGLAEAPATFLGGRRLRRERRDAEWPATAGSRSGFAPGQRVFHQKFGYGRITTVDGNKLEIAFEKAGVKKVINSFVEAA
ncbi:MAG: DNA helicase II [Rhodospirillales bacterium]|nr:DNA helicase II [Rhodospirillales bacterium]